MIEPNRRLRRAVLANDLLIVKRLIRAHPALLRNPDYDDKSNTSLHLAASNGFLEIANHLIECGHEEGEISRNTDHDTPLMLAARNGHIEVAKVLVEEFPRCIVYRNARGLEAISIASQYPQSTALIPVLLQQSDFSASPHTRDHDGNTPLHHASASGSLKALRILLAAGANPLAKNHHDWTPLAYSQTVAAEVYFKNLVAELERRKVEGQKAEEERERLRAAGLRVVGADEEDAEATSPGNTPKKGDVVPMTPVDDEETINDALKRHWSPTMERHRPMTPGSTGKAPMHDWDSRMVHMRTSSSGD